MEPGAAGAAVIVVADDLMWSTRLASAVERAGYRPIRARRWDPGLLLEGQVAGVIVDLAVRTGQGGVEAVAVDAVPVVQDARAAGLRTIAVGQHEDLALRKRALAAGAERVFAYAKLFADGPGVIRAWLGAPAGLEAPS